MKLEKCISHVEPTHCVHDFAIFEHTFSWNMVNEEDVIRSILHEFEHTHQDPKEYEMYKAQGYDGLSNPHEVAARNAEEGWQKYSVESKENPK